MHRYVSQSHPEEVPGPAATTARACHFVAETRRENLARWNCQTYCGVCSPRNQEIDPGHYKRLSFRFPTSHPYDPPFKV